MPVILVLVWTETVIRLDDEVTRHRRGTRPWIVIVEVVVDLVRLHVECKKVKKINKKNNLGIYNNTFFHINNIYLYTKISKIRVKLIYFF